MRGTRETDAAPNNFAASAAVFFETLKETVEETPADAAAEAVAEEEDVIEEVMPVEEEVLVEEAEAVEAEAERMWFLASRVPPPSPNVIVRLMRCMDRVL